MRIVLVEDNPRVTEVVEAALRGAGHVVQAARTRAEAAALFGQESFDLAIFDIGLPDGSGLDLCRSVRAQGLDLSILVLTARTDVSDRVDGLDAGADDYLGKPFSVAELLARVRALGRRGPHWSESVRAYDGLKIDRDRRVVTVDGEPAALTPREFEIVCLLAWRDGRVASRDEILEMVWGDATEGGAASLEVLVARIRRKLARPGRGEVIRTARQAGYAWALPLSKRS